jgi:three-Cys-motif partner protein
VPELLQFDQIGYWSEVKLEIVKEYASAYSTILAAQTKPRLKHLYIDAFAGAGVHQIKATRSFVPGSPLNALLIRPPFREYHLIDIASEKVENLRRIVGDRKDVWTYQGDCNEILLDQILPRVRYNDYKRALCLLDPYGLHLNWRVILTAGQMKR